MTYDIAVETLLCRYKEIYKSKGNSPDWATPKTDGSGLVHPSIPFVGKDYFNQPVRIMLYASAENLSGYGKTGYLDNDELAINRHRIWSEMPEHEGRFFPHVHINPINNGALILSTYHIVSKLMEAPNCTPAEFLETISCANYGKYSIKDEETKGKNLDYANQAEKLGESQEFIRADIEVLKPDYIIMVKQMYSGSGRQKEFIDSIKGQAKIISIPQISPQTIIHPYLFRKFAPAKIDELHPTIRRWLPNFKAGTVSGPYFMSVFSYLDDVMQQVIEQ